MNRQDPIVPVPSPPEQETKAVVSGKTKGQKLRSILSTVAIIAAAPLVALILVNFVFHPYEVDGDSMESTLQDNDRLIVWKLPKTIARATNNDYIPSRGDVIVFEKDDGDFEDKGRQLIKRIVGLPGDRVVVSDDKITVYNLEKPEGFNPDSGRDYSANIDDATEGRVDLIVPEGELFVAGDNRGNSLDSRSFGTIASEDIVGELVVRIFPLHKFKSFL